jgi:hypothetical protein
MVFRVGLESNNEGYRTIAWAREHPGCFAYGLDQDEALSNLPPAIWDYSDWISRHEPTWVDTEKIELAMDDSWVDYDVSDTFERVDKDGYTVEPFFLHDWKPLTADDIERARKLLVWSREDLLAVVENLSPAQWALKKEGERWDIASIVNHIGGAEWWYLHRLDLAFPRAEVPAEPLERLQKVRACLNERLPGFVGSSQVVGKNGELWSPRKVIRRALWHERDHTLHIRKLL